MVFINVILWATFAIQAANLKAKGQQHGKSTLEITS